MRIKSKSRTHFWGSHKGAEINIEHEPDGRFYIQVRGSGGGYLYDGWAPEGISTMREAKREALYGSGSEARP